MAAGAAGWGAVAERYGFGTALPAAAGAMLPPAAAAAARFRLSGDREPAPARALAAPAAEPAVAAQATGGA